MLVLHGTKRPGLVYDGVVQLSVFEGGDEGQVTGGHLLFVSKDGGRAELSTTGWEGPDLHLSNKRHTGAGLSVHGGKARLGLSGEGWPKRTSDDIVLLAEERPRMALHDKAGTVLWSAP
jgi:hypothetical protein